MSWGRFLITFCIFLTFSLGSVAGSKNKAPRGGDGGGDFFPLHCVDFTGIWRSDIGHKFKVDQDKCEFLRISSRDTVTDEYISVDVIPDRKMRRKETQSACLNAEVSHAWDNLVVGKSIKSRTLETFEDHVVEVTEVLESVNYYLVLKNTFQTIYREGEDPVHEPIVQTLYRRCEACEL